MIYVLLQIVFIGALPASALGHGLAALTNPEILAGPFAAVAALGGLAWLAHDPADRRVHLPVRHRPDLHDSGPRGSATAWPGTGTTRRSSAKVDSNGVPWVGLILAFLFGLVFLLPFPSWRALVGLITVGAAC